MSDTEDASGGANGGAEVKAEAGESTNALLAEAISSLHRMLENQLTRDQQKVPKSERGDEGLTVRLRPPPAFTPKMKFDVWEAQFLAYMDAHRTPHEHRTAVLLSLLAPECQEFFLNSQLSKMPIDEALKALRSRYTESNVQEASYMELVAAQQKPSESIAEFFDRMSSLARLAGVPTSEAEHLIRARFCYGMRDKSLAERLMNWASDLPRSVTAAQLAEKAKEMVGVQQLLQPTAAASCNFRKLESEKADLEARVAELEKQLSKQNRDREAAASGTFSQGNSRASQSRQQSKASAGQPYHQVRAQNHSQSKTSFARTRSCFRCGGEDHRVAECPAPVPFANKQSGNRKGRTANQAQGTSETGRIVSWKGKFGFIQSEQLPEQLFFHRGELSDSLRYVADQHQLVGTRVKFRRHIDQGRQRDQACDVAPATSVGQAQCAQVGSEDDVVDSSFFVQLSIGDSKVMACLDSGANASVIGKDAMDRLVRADPVNNVFTPAQRPSKATAFNGSTTTVLGSLCCEVEVGRTKKEQKFLCIAESTAEALLGMDFLRNFSVVLDFTGGQVLVAGEPVPVIEGDKGVFRLRRVLAACNSELPPRSETLIPSRVLDPVPNSSGIVSSKLFAGDSECFVARSVDRVSETNHVLVRLLNSSDHPVTVGKGEEIASFKEVSTNEVIVPTELNERDFSLDQSASLNSKLMQLPSPSKDTADWLIKEFRLDQTTLTPKQLSLTLRLLNYFRSQVSQNEYDLGRTKLHEMSIELSDKGSRPVTLASRRTTPAQKEFLDQYVSQLLAQGVVEECDSDWSSPIVLVKKKDGSQRLCIDYRAVNKLIKPCSFPLPLIEESFDSLAGSAVFCSLDLTSAYWQVGVREEDRDFTAFSCPQGTFRWTVVPFGIKTAPANFAKLMHKVFRPLLMRVSLIYLDDIIIKAVNNDQMITHLALVLWQLRKANLKIKPAKCELFKDRVKFLGFIVSAHGIEADPAKTKAVQDWCVPADKKQLLSFLGFANYYRKFVPRFSVIAAPLYSLAKGSDRFRWLECHSRAFDELKRSLCAPPVLAYPDLSSEGGSFVLDCDSSLEGVGAVLSQEGPDGHEQVVAYASKKFSPSQMNYCATMRELLGLVLMLEHFRPYLLDRPFTVRVDAAALQWLHTKKHATGMLAQWLATIDLFDFKVQQSTLERLAEYDFEVKYRPGKEHVNADALSRNPKFRADHFDCPTCQNIPEFQKKFHEKSQSEAVKQKVELRHVAVQCRTTGVEVKAHSDVEVQVRSDLGGPPRTEVEVQTCSDIEIQTTLDVETQTRPEPEAQSKADVRVLNQAEAEVQTQSDADVGQSMPETASIATEVAKESGEPNKPFVRVAQSFESSESTNIEFEWAREAQDTCVDLKQLIDCVLGRIEKPPKADIQACSREIRTLWSLFDELQVGNGILYRTKSDSASKRKVKLLVVPETADVTELVTRYHCQLGHCGVNKTLKALKSRFAIADLETYVRGILAECEVCARTKKSKWKNKMPMQPELAGYPNQVVHVDHAGPFSEQEGNRYLLVMVDRFSGFVEVIPVADVSAETTARAILVEWVTRYGTMDQIVSDNGTAFANSIMTELSRLLEIDMVRITARRPQANGKAERMIQSVKAQIRAICLERQIEWPLAAYLAALSIRTTVAESTGFTPARLFLGRELSLPLDLIHDPPRQDRYNPESYAHYLHKSLVEVSATARHIRGKAQERQKRYYDRSVRHSDFEVGELVWVLNPDHRGLSPSVWMGPYKVIQKISERNYRLIPEFARINPLERVPNPSHNVYNVDRMKRCIRKPTYQDITNQYGAQVAARIPSSRLGIRQDTVTESSDPESHESALSVESDLQPVFAEQQPTVQPQQSPELVFPGNAPTSPGTVEEEAEGALLQSPVTVAPEEVPDIAAEVEVNGAADVVHGDGDTAKIDPVEEEESYLPGVAKAPINSATGANGTEEDLDKTVEAIASEGQGDELSLSTPPLTTRSGRIVNKPSRFRAFLTQIFSSAPSRPAAE